MTAIGKALSTSAMALLLGAGAAAAQGYGHGQDGYGNGGYGPQAYGPSEEVEVIAPRPRPKIERGNNIDLAPQKVSLSQAVPLGDLDLRTAAGAHEARARVRDAAYSVCGRLVTMVRYRQPGTPSCFRQALSDGLVRADEAIWTARHSRSYRVRYQDYGGE